MPRTCLACSSPERNEIDTAIVSREPYRNIAKRVLISPAALLRHKVHVSQAIVKASAEREEQFGDNLLDEMRRIQQKAWELLAKTEMEGDHRASIMALREVRECLKSLGDILASAQAKPESAKWDVSVLSDEDLQTVERIFSKAAIKEPALP